MKMERTMVKPIPFFLRALVKYIISANYAMALKINHSQMCKILVYLRMIAKEKKESQR
jgi:hypothetical protein